MNDASFSITHYTENLAGHVQSGGATPLAVSYDAASRSYTLTAGGVTESFGPDDHIGLGSEPYSDYARATDNSVSFFTIGTPSIEGRRAYRFVNGGYWQRNVGTADGGFDLHFYPFTYGLPTRAADLPRSGTAGYAIDMFGFYTDVGTTGGTRAITGDGSINVDFSNARLQLSGSSVFYDLINGRLDDRRVPFTGTATIASDATFSGTFYLFATDRFAGRFYGPGAAELGAVFWSVEQPNQTVVNHFEGTIVGQRADSVVPINFLLTELIADQAFPITRGMYDSGGRLAYKTDGSYTYITDIARNDQGPVFEPLDKVEALSTPDYTVYRASFNGGDYQLGLATAGNVNSQIKLHYASFGEITVLSGPELNTTSGPYAVMGNSHYFTYGLPPSFGMISPSGTGSYSGIIVGKAVNPVDQWSVAGTSAFQLNFQTGAMTATLKMTGMSLTGGAALTMPDLTFRDGFVNFQDGSLRGQIVPVDPVPGYGGLGLFGGQLYGPSGEELGGVASFSLYNVGGTSASTQVAAVTLAKREGP